MSKYLNPFTDFGFKKLFGEESSKESLISFLNELLRPEGVNITSITYLNTEQLGTFEDDRRTFYDLYCTDGSGKHFIVEIQRQQHKNFKERMLFYSTYPIQHQSERGDWNFELTAVYVVAIMDFKLEETAPDKVVTRVKLMNPETQTVFYDKLTYVYIEIPKFKKKPEQLESLVDKWLFLLGEMEELEHIPSNFKEHILMKFLQQAELLKLSEKDRRIYEHNLKIYRDNRLVDESSLERGIAKGIAIGKAEGKAEVARNLLKLGVAIETVMQATDLSFDEIADLKAST